MSYLVQYDLIGKKVTQIFAYNSIGKLKEAIKGYSVRQLISPEGVRLIWNGKVTKKGRKRRTVAALREMVASNKS